MDDDQTIIATDWENQRVIQWTRGATVGEVLAGRYGLGNGTDQLNYPSDAVYEKATDSVYICDEENQRVLKWKRKDYLSGRVIIKNIRCLGVAVDGEGYLYVSDQEKHDVKRFVVGDEKGIVVAGGNGKGNRSDQLNTPLSLFVDRDQTVYVSDYLNHRVMKWLKDAKQGILVTDSRGQMGNLSKVTYPTGLFVDALNTIYIADSGNDRILRWEKGAPQGTVIAGGNYPGTEASGLLGPTDLTFDRQGNLYVADYWNHRIQRFSLAPN